MIIQELKNRHILSDMTSEEELTKLLESDEKITLYCGFDPTADSLHVGSMLPLMNMKRFKEHGHNVIALIGGATGLIGDPSFKASERQLNSVETVELFKRGITEQIRSFLGDDVLIVDNLSWTQNMDVITFLRDIGKHFSVNAMMNKESVKRRIEREGDGISFTEFSYQLLQGMDFLKLKEMHGCCLQIGGSDQMGNITAGTNLIHRVMGNQETAFGLTTKLITKSNGEKFGKSESGTVWLSKEKTSPFDFFQFWLKTTDEDVYTFLKFFSTMSVQEIDELEKADKDRRPEAQMILAKEMTVLIHGEDGLKEAMEVTDAMISGDFSHLALETVQTIANGLEVAVVKKGVSIAEALVESGLAQSRTKAREFVRGKAVSVNGEKITDENLTLDGSHLVHEKFIFMKRGKRNMGCVIFD